MLEMHSEQLSRLSALLGESAAPRGLKLRFKQSGVKDGRIAILFEQAGRSIPALPQIVSTIFSVVCVSVFGVTFVGWSALILGPVLLVGLYLQLVAGRYARAQVFERDYPAFLLSLASSIRTGLDPLIAFAQCGELFSKDSVIATEIAITIKAIEGGEREERALKDFARSICHPDISLFRAALILSRKQGSSLGSCLNRLARVTRQRQSFRRKIRGAVAMQRLSAFGISACTVIVGIIQGSSNPQALADAWNHPMGRIALSSGLGLVLCGLLWMMYMSRRRL